MAFFLGFSHLLYLAKERGNRHKGKGVFSKFKNLHDTNNGWRNSSNSTVNKAVGANAIYYSESTNSGEMIPLDPIFNSA
jgi:activator of HSP90 ATPase